ncbi:MAG: VOC family protein [Acidobacteria bacterium]|nr:VOC family protein [Acidobacteriota bacterium]
MTLKHLTPMLETNDLIKTIKFYTEKLGFSCNGLYPNQEDPCWAMLNKDKVEIMFSLRNYHSTIEKPIMTGSLYLYPDNVDEVWEELKDKVIVDYPIENFGYGMREFAIRDCNGYLIQFGQEID